MRRAIVAFGFLAAAFGALTVAAGPASAEFFGCDDQHPKRASSVTRPFASSPFSHELSAQSSRPRITVYPRERYGSLPPNAKRQCRATLVKEYRLSGTVIVPQMRCWWEY